MSMRKYYDKVIFILSIVILSSCTLQSKQGEKDFIFGIDISWEADPICPVWKDLTQSERIAKLLDDLDELGVNGVHFWISTSSIRDRFDMRISKNEVTDELIEKYIQGSNFSLWDELIDALHEKGLDLLSAVSHGYTGSLPCFKVDSCPFKLEANLSDDPDELPQRYLPDVVGRDHYIGWAYLNTRAIVRRYRDKIRIWQLENEVNVTCETILFGWRHGSLWCDKDFVIELVGVIREAVLEEDPEASLTINFHTDLPVHMELSGNWFDGHFEDDVKRFWDFVDIVGLDFYPNYMAVSPLGGGVELAEPSLAFEFEGRYRKVREVMEDIGRTKPIMIIETGYPSAPTKYGFSEERQAQFLRNIFDIAIKLGIDGVWYFKLTSPEKTIPSAPDYQQVESYWGFYRADRTRKPIFDAYKEVISSYN